MASSVHLGIPDEKLAARRAAMEAMPADDAWNPRGEGAQVITRALKAYAGFVTSAESGEFREF